MSADAPLVTAERFEPLTDTTFAVASAAPQAPVDLVLRSVARWGPEQPAEGGRRPFTLTFRGPSRPLLPQATYPLRHDVLGTQDVFLVPIARDEDGCTYEAVFS